MAPMQKRHGSSPLDQVAANGESSKWLFRTAPIASDGRGRIFVNEKVGEVLIRSISPPCVVGKIERNPNS